MSDRICQISPNMSNNDRRILAPLPGRRNSLSNRARWLGVPESELGEEYGIPDEVWDALTRERISRAKRRERHGHVPA